MLYVTQSHLSLPLAQNRVGSAFTRPLNQQYRRHRSENSVCATTFWCNS